MKPTRGIKSKLKPDGTPDDNNRVEIGPTQLAFNEWDALGLTIPNLDDLREYRLKRVREEMVKADVPAVLLFDPVNIRYATDTSNMQVWDAHDLCRACFITAEGPVLVMEMPNCEHIVNYLPLVDELKLNTGFIYFFAGGGVAGVADNFASGIDELIKKHCGNDKRLVVDKIEIAGLRALDAVGIDIIGGQQLIEHARAIKDQNEINAMRCSLAAMEASILAMQQKLCAGITENELWATLHYENICRGGEWIETRLLASGPRTNPWFQECGPRVIQKNDLVVFDTDTISTYGYCADLSRAWLCDSDQPSDKQKELYKLAYEEIQYNLQLIKPGLGFQEFSEKSFPVPEKYQKQRYGVIAHGVGLCDEYPAILPPGSYEGPILEYDGVLQTGMTLCIESYIGAVGELEGVKLEEQILVTETGYEILSRYPFEDAFLT